MRKDNARMPGNFFRKSDARKRRRLYLFVLMTSVLFLISLFAFPLNSIQPRKTSVEIQIVSTATPEATNQNVLESLKRQLGPEELDNNLQAIAANCSLESELLTLATIDEIRSQLNSGPLDLQLISPVESTGQGLVYSLSLSGSGTPDEVLLVHKLANGIRRSMAPVAISENALLQLSEIQSQIREAETWSQATRTAIVSTVETYDLEKRQMFARSGETVNRSELDSSNWELANLIEQRKRIQMEYEANQLREFSDKKAIQNTLARRIDQLDQKIQQFKTETGGEQRVAAQSFEVEKATFVDRQALPEAPDTGSGSQDLTTDLALAINKLDLIMQNQKQTSLAARQLSEMLQQPPAQVFITEPEISVIEAGKLTRIWLLLAISGVINGLLLTRIDSRAFALVDSDPQKIEKKLSIPVVGQIVLPDADGNAGRARRAQWWVNGMIHACERLLFLAFVVFLLVLLINSQFSVDWLSDPIQVLRNSFR